MRMEKRAQERIERLQAGWIPTLKLKGSAAAVDAVYCSRSSLWMRFFRTFRFFSRQYVLQAEHLQG
jgi:hypothetical protein